jgi:integrase
VIYPDSATLRARLEEIEMDYEDADRAPATVATYEAAWSDFTDFCEAIEAEALPADEDTVASYLLWCAEQRDLAVATLQKRRSAIRYHHRQGGHTSPTSNARVREVLERIKRTKGSAQTQARPLLTADVRRICRVLTRDDPMPPPGTADRAWWLRCHRDRAIVAVGFAGAFRRGELAAMQLHDLRWGADRLRIDLPRSKADQEGRGETVVLTAGTSEADPVAALRSWIDVAAVTEGHVFRGIKRNGVVTDGQLSGASIKQAVQRAASAAHLDTERVTGHSLRAGYATQAVLSGVEEARIMRHMRLSSVEVFRRYVRLAEEHSDDMSAALGI